MSKTKEHIHEAMEKAMSDKMPLDSYMPDVINNTGTDFLSKKTRINIKVLITLALMNEIGGFTKFYMSPETIKDLNDIRDELDKL